MADTIKLTVPTGRPYLGVVRLVVAGLAARSDLSLDALDDVQLALDALLSAEFGTEAERLDVEIAVEDSGLAVAVGPLDPAKLDAGLSDGGGGSVGLARLLDTTTSGYEIERRDGVAWVRLRKGAAGVEA